MLGKCDDIIKNLAGTLGWLNELKEIWAETRTTLDNPPPTNEPEEEPEEESEDQVAEVGETEEEKLQREIAWLTKSVDEAFKITDDLKKRVEKEAKEENRKKELPSIPTETADVGSSEKSGSNL